MCSVGHGFQGTASLIGRRTSSTSTVVRGNFDDIRTKKTSFVFVCVLFVCGFVLALLFPLAVLGGVGLFGCSLSLCLFLFLLFARVFVAYFVCLSGCT